MSGTRDCRYTREHEWAKLEGDQLIRVGISNYAQGELGDVVYLELPKVGRQLKKGESFSSVESVKAVSDVYAPVDGEVVEVNTELEGNPALLNQDPENAAWMIVLKPADVSQLESLMDADKYAGYIAELSK